MCGGGIVKKLFTPVSDLAAVAAAPVTGGASLSAIPLINAGETYAQTGNLGHALLSGGEALAGQEVLGALGIGQGNPFVNNELGINISPAATGLPDLGAKFGSIFSGGSGGASSAGNTSVGTTTSAGTGAAGPAPSGGAAVGGASAGATAAPVGVPFANPDITSQFASGLSGGENFTGLSGVPSLENAPGIGGATAAAAPVAGAAEVPNSAAQFLSNPSLGTFGHMLAANENLALPAVGVAADAIKGNQLVKGQRQLENIAGQQAGQSAALESYINTGTLPPGVQASINQAADAAKARIRSRYASMGGSGSSAMQQELANVDNWAAGAGAQQALSLLQTGIQESNLAGSLYSSIANEALAQDKQLSDAFGSLAAAASGQPQLPRGLVYG